MSEKIPFIRCSKKKLGKIPIEMNYMHDFCPADYLIIVGIADANISLGVLSSLEEMILAAHLLKKQKYWLWI